MLPSDGVRVRDGFFFNQLGVSEQCDGGDGVDGGHGVEHESRKSI